MRSLNRYAQKPLPWNRAWKSIHGNADAIKTPLLLPQKNRMQNHPITAEAVDVDVGMRMRMSIMNTGIQMVKAANADIPTELKPGTMNNTNTNITMWKPADADTSTNMSINMNIMNTTMAKPADADMNIRRRLPLQNPPHDPKLLFPPLQSEKFIP